VSTKQLNVAYETSTRTTTATPLPLDIVPLNRTKSSSRASTQSPNMDWNNLKDTVSNMTLYDVKAGVRKVQNGTDPTCLRQADGD
jgi:hypothetical protein